MKTFSEKVLGWGTCVLVFLIPFIYFSNLQLAFVSSKTFLLYGLTEILFFIWLYKAITDTSYRFSKKEIFYFLPLLLFIFWLTISGIVGSDPHASFWSSLGRGTGLLTLLHVTALTFVVTSFLKKEGLKNYGHKILSWFLAGAFILLVSIWLGNEGFKIPISVLEKSKGGGFIGNSSLAATVFIFSFFFSWFLIFSSKIQQKSKILLGILIALIVFSPLFVNLFGASVSARGALVGICLGVATFFLVVFMCSKKKMLRMLGGAILALCFVGVAGIFISLLKPQSFIHEKFNDSVLGGRLIFWDSAQKAISAHPFFGFGPENFRIAQQKYFDPRIYSVSAVAETWSDRSHNIVFDTGVSGGYPAIIFYFVFIGSIVVASFWAYKLEKISLNQFGTLVALVVAYVVQNLFVFDSNVSLVCFGLLTAVSFGSLFSKTSEEKSVSKVKHNGGLTTILVFLFAITFIFFTVLPFIKTAKIKSVMNSALNKRSERYDELLKGSSIGDGFDVGIIAENIYQTYESNLQSLKNDQKLLPYVIRDLESYTLYLEVISKKHPQDLRLRFNLARLYILYMDLSGKRGDKPLSQKIIHLADMNIEASPNDPQHYWLKAITLAKIGQKEEARIVAQEAFDRAPYIDFSQELLSSLK